MISDESRNIGLRIREERIKRTLTQVELGTIIGYTGSKICRLERGYHPVTDELIITIARALGITVDDLLTPPQCKRVSYMTLKTVRHIGRPPRKGR